MNHVLIQNEKVETNNLPQGITLDASNLSIQKHLVIKDTIKISIHDKNSKPFKVVVGENTQVKLILELNDQNNDQPEYQIDLETKEGSIVKFLLISNIQSEQAKLNFNAKCFKDSNVEFIGGFISHIIDAKLYLDLVGRGANLKVRTIAVSATTNEQNLDIRMTHHAPDTSAEMTNIGIASDFGKVKLNGVGQIEQGMKNSNAYQTLRGIIISDTAEIDVNPILIIDEYDVKAGHAATVGRLEEDVLYYLRSRGLTLKEATKLIINGFVQPIIDEIDDEPLKESVIKLVNERI